MRESSRPGGAASPQSPFFAVFDAKPQEYYRELAIKADALLHRQALAEIAGRCPAGGRVLDIGAGAGAFAQRLADAGFAVEAVDLEPGDFQPAAIPVSRLDLDDPADVAAFGARNRERYDAVSCLEVLEHLHDPWQLMRLAATLLRPGGAAVLSTPNIASWHSRLVFLTRGRFFQFEDADVAYGHVHPICIDTLASAVADAGLILERLAPGGLLPKLWLNTGPRGSLFNLLGFVLRPFMRGLKDGWCVLAVAVRPATGPPAQG